MNIVNNVSTKDLLINLTNYGWIVNYKDKHQFVSNISQQIARI